MPYGLAANTAVIDDSSMSRQSNASQLVDRMLVVYNEMDNG